ncbi:hypothetical protein QOL99_04775 [Deinococcus sp. MIMF12]|uniref:PHP domain-containing protein n=1 Tax=Deinococcus rhizophilus TaxID=3049544 RepID=A0ABT7JEH8_9DEIO|nr:AAA family ATPase [Deinococcus rhizophilus]MDL2343464.1 hypothetical protein [Deinococcus rhizophilus]
MSVEKDPFKILRMIHQAGINCVAITDHFSGAFIDELKRARKIMSDWSEFRRQTLPTILPGVEIEVDGVHLLCVFPEKYGTAEINYFLGRIGIRPDQYGDQEANCTAGLEVIRSAVDEYGGLIIAAHANSNKGLLGIRGKNFVDLCSIIDVVEINRPNFDRDVEETRKHRPELANKPFLRGSDTHSEAGLTKDKFHIKMQSPSFSSIKQIIFEPFSRFMTSQHKTKILGVTFSSPNGIFENQTIAFNHSMNTIIGGRGDGKSILMDSIRYCLEDYPSLEYLNNIEGGMLSRINGTYNEGDSITIMIAHNSDIYACVRGVTVEKVRKVYSANAPAKWYKLEAGDFTEINRPDSLSFTIYSQGEIESLTRELDVLGEICDSYNLEIGSITNQVNEKLSALDFLFSKRLRIQRIEENIIAKKEQNAELSASILRFENLLGSVDKSVYRKMLRANDESSRMINEIWDAIEEMRRIGGSIVGRLEKVKSDFMEGSEFINDDFKNYFNHVRNTAIRIFEIMTFSDIGKFNDTPERISWKQKLDDEKNAYDDLIRSSGMESQEALMPRLVALRERQKKLSEEIEADSVEIIKLNGIKKEIQEMLGLAIHLQNELRKTREKNIENLNMITPEMVYIEYAFDNSEFKEWLDESLKSKGISEKGVTISKLSTLMPNELLLAAVSGDVEAIKRLGISESNSNIVIAVLNSVENQNLHRVSMAFTPIIGLIKGGNKFPTSNLSIGEKVSAVFPLLTLNNGKPILLDQPEDDLDHNYIIDNITHSIKQNKTNQQFIIITHNPNIPVLADSDQIIKMKRLEERQVCIVETQGAIEDDTIRSHVMKLDGGMEAIEIRYKRYRS